MNIGLFKLGENLFPEYSISGLLYAGSYFFQKDFSHKIFFWKVNALLLLSAQLEKFIILKLFEPPPNSQWMSGYLSGINQGKAATFLLKLKEQGLGNQMICYQNKEDFKLHWIFC